MRKGNEITPDEDGTFFRVNLVKGGEAFVLPEDVDLVRGFTWRLHIRSRSNRKPYARTQVRLPSGRRVWVWMHRVIMGLSIESERVVDHKDGDGLNNRRGNLRVALDKQNCRNRRSRVGVTGFKGVTKRGKRFAATIMINRKTHWLGTFETAALAAEAYDRAARRLHREYASTNADMRQVAA